MMVPVALLVFVDKLRSYTFLLKSMDSSFVNTNGSSMQFTRILSDLGLWYIEMSFEFCHHLVVC